MSGKPPKHPPSIRRENPKGVVNSPEALEEAREKRNAEEKAELNKRRFEAFFGNKQKPKGGKTRKYRRTGKHTTKKVKRRNNGRRTRS
jgi:hypothetical protein